MADKVYVVYEWEAGEEPHILKVFEDEELAECYVKHSNKKGGYIEKHYREIEIFR